jgi:hypothetical protein
VHAAEDPIEVTRERIWVSGLGSADAWIATSRRHRDPQTLKPTRFVREPCVPDTDEHYAAFLEHARAILG